MAPLYALPTPPLGGSLLLFGLLAVVMIATRHIDWYGLNGSRPAPSAAT